MPQSTEAGRKHVQGGPWGLGDRRTLDQFMEFTGVSVLFITPPLRQFSKRIGRRLSHTPLGQFFKLDLLDDQESVPIPERFVFGKKLSARFFPTQAIFWHRDPFSICGDIENGTSAQGSVIHAVVYRTSNCCLRKGVTLRSSFCSRSERPGKVIINTISVPS